MDKIIAVIKKFLGKYIKTLAKADDIAEEFFTVAGKLEVYADAKAKAGATVKAQLEALESQGREIEKEVDKAKTMATKIRGILEG